MGHQFRECGPAGAVYGLGIVGSAIYFIGHASGFWNGVLGFIQAIIWPAIMTYKAFEFLYK